MNDNIRIVYGITMHGSQNVKSSNFFGGRGGRVWR